MIIDRVHQMEPVQSGIGAMVCVCKLLPNKTYLYAVRYMYTLSVSIQMILNDYKKDNEEALLSDSHVTS
jgi:hypothetical protein